MSKVTHHFVHGYQSRKQTVNITQISSIFCKWMKSVRTLIKPDMGVNFSNSCLIQKQVILATCLPTRYRMTSPDQMVRYAQKNFSTLEEKWDWIEKTEPPSSILGNGEMKRQKSTSSVSEGFLSYNFCSWTMFSLYSNRTRNSEHASTTGPISSMI